MHAHYWQLFFIRLQDSLLYLSQRLSTKDYIIFTVILCCLLAISRLTVPRKKKARQSSDNLNAPSQHTDSAMSAIAGDDIITTQLDLARAYIEMDEKKLAKDILAQVFAQGNNQQQQEAKQLMSTM